jgi:tRNA A-37 threonylcarbamoyl transferase component Bud32
LNSSSKINIPNVYSKDDENHVIIMKYIFGKNLCDVINCKDVSIDNKTKMIIDLAKWFFNFHNHFKKNNNFIIRGDSNLRNFIVNNQIWGVDFEESRIGNPIEDISSMIASILSTHPEFTNEKFTLSKIFSKTYSEISNFKLLNLNKEISFELLKIIQYRPEQEDLLRKYSERFISGLF